MPCYINGVDANFTKTGLVETKVDTVDTVVDGIAVETTEIEHHVHGTNKVYGIAAAAPLIMARCTLSPLTVTGGSSAYGDSILLHKGTGYPIDELYFDPNKLQIVYVATANRATLLEFYTGTMGAQVAYTGEADDDIITAAGHSLTNGDRFIFGTLNNETYGVVSNKVYFALDVSGDTFKAESTSGGGAINITTDISGYIKKLSSPTKVSEIMVSMSSQNTDAMPLSMTCDRLATTKAFWVVGKGAGGTNEVQFFMDLHTYTA